MEVLLIMLAAILGVAAYRKGYIDGYQARDDEWRKDAKSWYQEALKSWKGEI